MNVLILRTHQTVSGLSKSRLPLSIRYLSKTTATHSRIKVGKIAQQIQYNHTSRLLHKNVAILSAPWISSFQTELHNHWPCGNAITRQSVRYFQLSPIAYESKPSKVEESIKKIQEKEKEKDLPKTETTDIAKAIEPKKSLQQRVWAELVHYYHGFRLLFIDIHIASKLVWKLLKGRTLTRREYNLLTRTTGDVFRLVPFSVFIIVPFMEFLLPVYIKLFPGMLPSTFESASDKETKTRNQLKVKLDMAKFLQKTLDEMDLQHQDHKSDEAREFIKFYKKLKQGDQNVRATPEEIMKFSKLFEDEITLDSLSREQLTALCKVVEVSTLGPTNLIRFQLKMKLRSLKADDRMIQKDGIESLTLTELQSACKARGMRSYGLSEPQLNFQLNEWIDLSLNNKIPPSLLLLSRALMLPENVPTADKLKASISVLPEAAAIQTKGQIGEREGKIDNKTKIDILRDEQRKIKEELDELKEVQKDIEKADVLLDKAPVITADTPISSKDIEVVSDAIEEVAKVKQSLLVEKEEIKELKEEIAEYKEDVEELQEISKQSLTATPIKESRASKMLLKKVDSIINKLDKTLADLEQKEASLQHQYKELDHDMPKSELVQIDEIMSSIKKMQKVSDEAKLEQIEKLLDKIDVDHDGQIKIDDVLKVIEAVGKDNVHLNEKQIEDLIELLSKEDHIQNEEKIKKVLAKRKSQEDKVKAEELADGAKTLTADSEQMDDKQSDTTVKSKSQTKIDERINKTVILSATEAAERQKDKILPLSSATSGTDVPNTPKIPSSSQPNNKDKML